MYAYLYLLIFCSPSYSFELKELVDGLSWRLKLKFLQEFPEVSNISQYTSQFLNPNTSQYLNTRRVGVQALSMGRGYRKEQDDQPYIKRLNIQESRSHAKGRQNDYIDAEKARQRSEHHVDVHSKKRHEDQFMSIEDKKLFLAKRRQEDQANPLGQDVSKDESYDMSLKLFRLMYESVRDSDLKVKRAELIKDHYTNSTTFEIGYLMGDVSDKFSIMTDISLTLKRFFKEWKPIEHVNAYEQIANQAIEVNHLIDLIRTVTKKEERPPHTRGVRS